MLANAVLAVFAVVPKKVFLIVRTLYRCCSRKTTLLTLSEFSLDEKNCHAQCTRIDS